MGFFPRKVIAFDAEGLVALNELLQEFGRGISDTNVAGNARIQIGKLLVADLGVIDFTVAQRVVAHTLGRSPIFWLSQPTSDIRLFETARRDSTSLYLTASGTGKARLFVGA